ncbi:hypothetical protein [Streptomyces sp. NPDC058653]|uniref:hypothetical protein n=1 Tax=Streptomyces sp. NPDC058653 TaxID=3346576 RepID=UPI00364D3F87
MSATASHASPQRAVLPTGDHITGEVRVPLALYSVDRVQGHVPLVLSRREAEDLLARLAELLAPTKRLVGVSR